MYIISWFLLISRIAELKTAFVINIYPDYRQKSLESLDFEVIFLSFGAGYYFLMLQNSCKQVLL
jgi:hypothetical protein